MGSGLNLWRDERHPGSSSESLEMGLPCGYGHKTEVGPDWWEVVG